MLRHPGSAAHLRVEARSRQCREQTRAAGAAPELQAPCACWAASIPVVTDDGRLLQPGGRPDRQVTNEFPTGAAANNLALVETDDDPHEWRGTRGLSGSPPAQDPPLRRLAQPTRPAPPHPPYPTPPTAQQCNQRHVHPNVSSNVPIVTKSARSICSWLHPAERPRILPAGGSSSSRRANDPPVPSDPACVCVEKNDL